ncbi:hypothetical protein [Microvirga sp. VF16]|uniref:hypothetical protein n=1 Tax=Microvirga sp. VF16 TaxID=2807101 RepID=UPI00193E031E|nr:hypothetical protein [Microvirga sp. VF16]QRM34924.1 hypothetical protein JO965_42450 [Microvirga sp. VF16]
MPLSRDTYETVPCGLSPAEIFAKADAFSVEERFKGTMSGALIAGSLGGKVEQIDQRAGMTMGGPLSDSDNCELVIGEDHFTVRLSQSHMAGTPRASFIVAQCVGHFILHVPTVKERYGHAARILVRSRPTTDNEALCQTEAQLFATRLLAPPDRLAFEWNRAKGSLVKLRAVLGMPAENIIGLLGATFATKSATLA